MTPELEAKAREWLCGGGAGHEDGEDGLRAMTCGGGYLVEALAEYSEYLLEIERKWWIERIEQERDKHWGPLEDEWFALDDLLTSVRERGGK